MSQRFGHEDFDQAICSKNVISRTWTKDFVPFENFIIGSL
jgi:hypothetical protein